MSLRYEVGRWTLQRVHHSYVPSEDATCRSKGWVVTSRLVHFPHVSEQLFQAIEHAMSTSEEHQMVLHPPKAHNNSWVRGLLRTVSNKIHLADISCTRTRYSRGGYCFRSLCYFQRTPNSWFKTRQGCHRLRELVYASLNVSREKCPPAVILSRRKSRKIINAHEVAVLIRSVLNVEPATVDFEEYSFEEQVTCLSGAQFLFAAHGAGLTNLVFLPSGARIVEFFPYSYVPSQKWYDQLATECGHYHIPIFSRNNAALADLHCAYGYRNSSLTECMSVYSCRSCMRLANVHVDIGLLSQALGKLKY